MMTDYTGTGSDVDYLREAMIRVLYCFLISLLTVQAADLSGKWTGTIQVTTSDGDTTTVPLLAELHQKGQELAGTLGRHAAEHQTIQKGRIDGTKVSFEVTTSDSGTPFTFELTATDLRLEGNMKGRLESGPVSGKVALTRASD